MKYNNLIVEKSEYIKIKRYIENAHYSNDPVFKRAIGTFLNELKTALLVEKSELPGDVVRFNSKVTIKTPFIESKTYQIVAPEESDLKVGKISILTPMALALFGYAVSDEIEWQFPNGTKTIQIIDVALEKQVFI